MRADEILPDAVDRAAFAGMSIRKGTVAAFLHNAQVWSNAAASSAERTEAGRDITEAIPSLRALGLFEVLAVRDARLAAFLAKHGVKEATTEHKPHCGGP